MIPCRDGAAFLGEALESVRAQTRPVHELIVVDDQSTDESVAIAKRFGATVLHTVPPGCTAMARNIGWRHASGELIAFLDADDRWRPRHLEIVAALLEATPDAVLGFGSIEMFGVTTGRYDRHAPATRAPVDVSRLAVCECPVPQMTCVIPRKELLRVGGYDETLAAVEDFELFARLSRQGPFVGAPDVTGDYRQHASQTTRARSRQVMTECCAVRARSLRAMRARLDDDEFALLHSRVRDLWLETVRGAWWEGDGATLDDLLSDDALLVADDATARAWRRRRIGLPAWRLIVTHGRKLKHSRFWPQAFDRVWRRLRGRLA